MNDNITRILKTEFKGALTKYFNNLNKIKHRDEVNCVVNEYLNNDFYYSLQHDLPELQLKIKNYLVGEVYKQTFNLQAGNPAKVETVLKETYDNLF